MMPNPCCCGACLLFSDNFNRADETWPNGSFDTGPFDSTGKWIGRDSADAHNKWRIASNELVITTTGESASTARPAARHIENINVVAASVEMKMKIPTGGLIQSFSINIITDLITGSPQLYVAIVKIIPGDCGTMQLFGKNNSGTTVQLGADIPLPGLVVNTWFTVKLCLNAQFKLASCSVGGNWHHGTTEPQDDPGDTRREVISTITVDEQASGTYHFDDFKLIELKQEVGYGYYYGYGYGDEPKCPVCRDNSGSGCESVTINFDSLDCRWNGDANGGCWEGSWSGVDSEGQPDATTSATLTFIIPALADGETATVTLSVGGTSAVLVVNSDGSGTETTGTEVATFAPGEIAFDVPLKLGICCFGSVLVASFKCKVTGMVQSEEDSLCDGDVCVSQENATLQQLLIMHDLGDVNCECDILRVNTEELECSEPSNCGPCRYPDGSLPSHILLLVDFPAGLGSPTGLNGAYVLDPSSGSLSCCNWSTSFILPQPNFGQGTVYTFSVIICPDGEGNAFLSVIIQADEFGGITNTHTTDVWNKSLPLEDDGMIDCHSLLGRIPYDTFIFSGLPFASSALIEVEA